MIVISAVVQFSGGSNNFEGVADQKILKGWRDGRQCISPVVIYRKCIQQIIGFYTEKGGYGPDWTFIVY